MMESQHRLIDYVEALQNHGRRDRLKILIDALEALNIRPVIQKSNWLGVTNVVVDYSGSRKEKPVLFSAHYDAVDGVPGANDNASGVAVLLGFCREIKQSGLPARIVFFDREEAWLRTPLLKIGLLGSLYYTFKANLKDIRAVCNLEFCGQGDFLAIWSIKTRQRGLPLLQEIRKAACRIDLPFKAIHVPWPYISSDHLSFRLRGLENAVTLSLVPHQQVPELEKAVQQMSLRHYLSRQWKPPDPLSVLHSRDDTSEKLSEQSLRLMLTLLMQLAHDTFQRETPDRMACAPASGETG